MESKYYTPKIEEFHVGFEYEMEILNLDLANMVEGNVDEFLLNCNGGISYSKYNKEWIGFRINKLSDYNELNVENNIKNIRVKYLSKEDIESLGFRFWKIHTGTTTHEFETSDGRYNITFDPNWGSSWNCSIQDEVDFTFFHGYVKNKSELKVILKQVGIINE